MKIVHESEVNIISKNPVVCTYKNKNYIYLRGSKYVGYDGLPADSFEVRFSSRILPDLCSTLTFVPVEN